MYRKYINSIKKYRAEKIGELNIYYALLESELKIYSPSWSKKNRVIYMEAIKNRD